MRKATKAITLIAIFIIVIVTISIFSSGMLQNNSSNGSSQNNGLATITPSSPTPSTQPSANQPQVQTYTGYLVSFNYVTSETNGVESTQLVFTNKTFSYAGYISLENNCVYNVTYYDNNPNQALSVAEIDLTIGFMGGAEQVSIANIAFTSPTAIEVMVQNAGSTTVNFTQAFVNGVAVSMNPSSPSMASSASTTISLSLPTNTPLSADASYLVKLITAMGTSVVNIATYNP